MGDKYNIHKDFALLKLFKAPINPVSIVLVNILSKLLFMLLKINRGIRVSTGKIDGYEQGKIKVTVYQPEDMGEDAPCLVYYHGGGFIFTGNPIHKRNVAAYALKTPCKVIYAHYRLSPKYPFPTGVEDCYKALEWVNENSAKLGINPAKIAVGGDSAGGALAAAVAQMARDRKGPGICFQMLIYPVIDCGQDTQSIRSFVNTPVWDAGLTEKMWKYYLKNGDYGMLQYASPIKAQSFQGLPDAYIETAEYDCLRDEGINYADVLSKSGIKVQLEQTCGTVHGYDGIRSSSITKQSVDKRVKALKEAFRL